jgi:hypothetical protein
LKLNYFASLSNFAFNFDLRRYMKEDFDNAIKDKAGGVLRTSTRSTLNRRANYAPLREHSP